MIREQRTKIKGAIMYKKIMVPLDGSELAECVLPHVEQFTSDCRVDTITFVRVAETLSPSFLGESLLSGEDLDNFSKCVNKADEKVKSKAASYLDEVVKRLKQGEVQFETKVLVGRVEDQLLEYADKNNFDLILIATHGRSGASRWVRGSIADRILRGSCVPVMMVRSVCGIEEGKD
jgi:nucleotide-binding universal stress UspA family protein